MLENAPKGGLTHQTKNGHAYYYHQVKSSDSKKWKKTYIRKRNMKFAQQLAQKEYLEDIMIKLNEQIQALTQFITCYNETALEQIYEKLPDERKQLIIPIIPGVKEKLKEWDEETYEPYDAYSEYKVYETDRGEMVRSKSEVIIANILNQHKSCLDYKYERPLKLMDKSGKEIVIHPDFTIINKLSGKIYYYEHVGRLDETRYATDFVKKMELYTANHIMQGKELLMTYEATGAPLNVACVRKIVGMCFE